MVGLERAAFLVEDGTRVDSALMPDFLHPSPRGMPNTCHICSKLVTVAQHLSHLPNTCHLQPPAIV